jgi:beta-aspartyl-peptidase (threonine type)
VVEPVILVHGGAWAIPDEAVEQNLVGVRAAMRAGWDVLQHKGTAVEACEAAVMSLEDNPAFDAGRGSFLTRDGRVQMDAMIMDGHTLRAGGVGCVERIRNPVRAARKVLEESPHVYLVARGAEAFAREHKRVCVQDRSRRLC